MIPQQIPVKNHYGNNSATVFDFDFYIEIPEQLEVTFTDFDGTQAVLEYGIDYEINPNSVGKTEGGSITFPIDGSEYDVLGWDTSSDKKQLLSLALNLPIEQPAEYNISGDLNKKNLEKSLDYLTRLAQIQARMITRSVKVQEGATATPDELIASLNEAQINAASSASAASASATAAAGSASIAESQATIATQQAAIVQTTYDHAMRDIETARTTALGDVEDAQAIAEAEIQSDKENALSAMNTIRTNYDSNHTTKLAAYNENATTKTTNYDTNASTKLSAYNTNADSRYSEYNTNASTKFNEYNTNSTTKSEALRTQYESYSESMDAAYDSTMKAYDSLYEGVNLEVKFATEIAQYPNKYAWLNARKEAGNFNGIHVGDYFFVPMAAGTVAGYNIAAQTFKCRIVGINTYKNCADAPIGNMLYIHSDNVISQPIKWNPADNNNGTSVVEYPWLASALYAVLNGVNNYNTANAFNKVAHGANAAGHGIVHLLPVELRNVLKQQRVLLDKRYSGSGLITGSTGWAWEDKGLLTAPCEVEVYGTQFKSNTCQTAGWWNPENNLSIQFPWYAYNCEHRIKTNANGDRCIWWLSSAATYSTGTVCIVYGSGHADTRAATNATVCAPLCFCI